MLLCGMLSFFSFSLSRLEARVAALLTPSCVFMCVCVVRCVNLLARADVRTDLPGRRRGGGGRGGGDGADSAHATRRRGQRCAGWHHDGAGRGVG
eukprot:469892-Rhodomonas_salina.1